MPRIGCTALMPRLDSPSGYARAAEEPAPIEFEDDDFDLSAEDIQPE